VRRRVLLAFLAAALVPGAAGAAPAQLIAAFDDDVADATGPGTYQKPGDSELDSGDFDLRRFEVWRDGDDAVFKVTLAAPFRPPAVNARALATPLPLWNGIFYQNIDIYIDTDPASPAGYAVCVPGRRVAFSEGRTWKAAVVLTPQPGPARAITVDALGEAGRHIVFAEHLVTQGRTVTARVPAAALGGAPRPEWAYSVHVSGARWERSFALAQRLANGAPEPDAFTMPVVPVVEAWAFGGAPEGHAYPRVIDVLLPRGADQRAVLGSFDETSGRLARVPFVGGAAVAVGPSATAAVAVAPVAAPASAYAVVDVADGVVTVSGPSAGLAPLRLGRVLDAKGQTVARIVVTRVLERGVVASVVEGGDHIQRGAPVDFSP
jgi:carbohydrate-binding DOMON domain-containing protein